MKHYPHKTYLLGFPRAHCRAWGWKRTRISPSHTWMPNATHINKTCPKCVMHYPRQQICDTFRELPSYASCHAYKSVVTHIWMHQATRILRHTIHVTYFPYVIHFLCASSCRVRVFHVTHTNESCHTFECVMPHWIRHTSHMIKLLCFPRANVVYGVATIRMLPKFASVFFEKQPYFGRTLLQYRPAK